MDLSRKREKSQIENEADEIEFYAGKGTRLEGPKETKYFNLDKRFYFTIPFFFL